MQGSWFIQVLGPALLTNCQDHDILTILSKVAKVVATEYESNSSRTEFNNKKQIPFIYSTLTNKLSSVRCGTETSTHHQFPSQLS